MELFSFGQPPSEEELDRMRMEQTVTAHEWWEWITNECGEKDLVQFGKILTSVSHSGENASTMAAHFAGIVLTTLKQRGICPQCGVNHDHELLDETQTAMEDGDDS